MCILGNWRNERKQAYNLGPHAAGQVAVMAEPVSFMLLAATLTRFMTLWFHSRVGVWSTRVLQKANVESGHLEMSKLWFILQSDL